MKKILLCLFIIVCFSNSSIYAAFSIKSASTQITSFKDPAYNNIQVKKMMVLAYGMSLNSRAQTERRFFKGRFAKTTTEVIPSVDILMPTRSYTDDEINELIKQNNIDAVLIVSLVNTSSSQTYIPEVTTGTINLYGNTGYFSANTFGGYYVSSPNAAFELKLFDPVNGNCMWIASANSYGKRLSEFFNLVDSLAIQTVKTFIQDQLTEAVKK